jgi:hypothetical protein
VAALLQERALATPPTLKVSLLADALEHLGNAVYYSESVLVSLAANDRLAQSLSVAIEALLSCAAQRREQPDQAAAVSRSGLLAAVHCPLWYACCGLVT